MGMFDYVTCNYDIPELADLHTKKTGAWQTKSLDNIMGQYYIDIDGGLQKRYVVRESVPEEERPFYGKPEWDDPWLRLAGSVRERKNSEKWEQYPHHGIVELHGISYYEHGHNVWVSVEFTFVSGKVLEYVVHNHTY